MVNPNCKVGIMLGSQLRSANDGIHTYRVLKDPWNCSNVEQENTGVFYTHFSERFFYVEKFK